jgi:hypothetical protein
MKRVSLIAALTSIMIMICASFCFAEDGALTLVSSYPKNGQTNTSMENLGVKLTFSNPINSDAAKKADADKFKIVDEEGQAIPILILFSEKNDGLVLVLADQDKGFTAKNNSEYKLVIDPEVVDNDGNTLGKETTISFRTYNQRVNNMVNMGMMFVMFGGIMFFSVRQNMKKEEEEAPKKEEVKKEAAFNPYKEAKRTGRPVEEIIAEQNKKEEKLAKKKSRKKKKEDTSDNKKIENCAELLNNVYHVHAPAPISKEDRSVEALKAMRKAEAKNSGGKGKKK